MKILIIDDDFNIHKILTMIIEHEKIGEVIENKDLDSTNIFKLIDREKPKIIIVDLLMPGKDGIEVIREIRSKYNNIKFIMISQVTSKDMIEKAYESGIEFFINKPINAMEVKAVLSRVINDIVMREKLNKIQTLFEVDNFKINEAELNNKESFDENEEVMSNVEDSIKVIMKQIGILSEGGEEDIIRALTYMIEHDGILDRTTLNEFFKKISSKPKSTEQRIRRTAFRAMTNLASLGIEDYMNETFAEFSTSLFSFDEIKKEMDFIRGKGKERGKVNLKKFLQGIRYYINK
ncbi:DNA-binding domain-containing protein [Clostridium algidicarnis]|uniref:Stage 0 sporulation protein A homolog n=2 Tax=Clostridium algidicarnis TaxID=37659 RepID=A0A2S6FXN8_9CLOT|nr:DNA-binding domain-containing protein [Clostridium algidicarnis]MBB6631374.1 DNA-binding domain-containing protein [Clostridium algidicarnis]MBB6697148.1 DNA-binding domain-containing protein [Clostridium algidicarnis]MBU3192432.1 response regulator [Clostridium algidicarnis]MBU3204421.1 response regulator [Clostridium algidicarnis]MBU3212496.1 response regulator [Clostridium algidicarnis]